MKIIVFVLMFIFAVLLYSLTGADDNGTMASNSYQIFLADMGAVGGGANGTSIELVFSLMTPYQDVYATDNAGDTLTTPQYFIISVPGAPTIGTATGGDTQATVTFTTPDSNGGSAITNYTVTSNPGNFTATGTGSQLTVTGLTNGTAYTFTVTATNAVGTGLQSISSNSVTPIGTQSITFPALTAKSYGVVDFDPGATASSGLAVTYTSSNPAVATISAGKIHVVGIGPTTITASQAGNVSFNAAADVTQSLTVNPATLTVTASDKSKTYGASNPALTIAYTGFVNGDTQASLTTQPVVATTATTSSTVGSYSITVSGGVSGNYTFTYVPGSLTVNKATLTVTANSISRIYGAANPAFTLSYSGFVNGDTTASLTSQPTATTTAITSSPAGDYPITVSGGVNSNYTITYVSGTLSISGGGTQVPVMEGWWLLPGLLAGVGMISRRRKQ